MNIQLLPTQSLVVPPEFVREATNATEDAQLMASVKKTGIQQPLIVLRFGDTYRVVKGTRRLGVAVLLNIPKVLCVVDEVPEGEDAESYARKIRFSLDEHRQDLLPTQRAQIIHQIMNQMGISKTDFAADLGVVPDTITNWLAPLSYVPEVQQAIDNGTVTMHAARVFSGLSEKGQRHILTKHRAELASDTGKSRLHKSLRKQYAPNAHPDFYVEPQKAVQRLAGQSKTRRRSPRAYTADEKKTLLNSVELKENELLDGKEEAKELRAQIEAAIPIVAAIQRNRPLRDYVAKHYPAMVEELKAFADAYV